eukprot:scaffold474_cov169-Ochromonas_danica.AAC.24
MVRLPVEPAMGQHAPGVRSSTNASSGLPTQALRPNSLNTFSPFQSVRVEGVPPNFISEAVLSLDK